MSKRQNYSNCVLCSIVIPALPTVFLHASFIKKGLYNSKVWCWRSYPTAKVTLKVQSVRGEAKSLFWKSLVSLTSWFQFPSQDSAVTSQDWQENMIWKQQLLSCFHSEILHVKLAHIYTECNFKQYMDLILQVLRNKMSIRTNICPHFCTEPSCPLTAPHPQVLNHSEALCYNAVAFRSLAGKQSTSLKTASFASSKMDQDDSGKWGKQ